jgi:hypothetical protein
MDRRMSYLDSSIASQVSEARDGAPGFVGLREGEVYNSGAASAFSDQFCSLFTDHCSLLSGGLQFEEDAGASGFEIERGGFAIVFAEDAGAHAEAKAGGFISGGLRDEGIEGAGGNGEL